MKNKFILTLIFSFSAYYLANGFHNIWILMWLSPIALCIYALDSSPTTTMSIGFLSYLGVGFADTIVYSYTRLGASGFVQITFIHAVVFAILLTMFRYAAIKLKHWSAIFAFAAGWVGYEFIFSYFSVHGTARSVAYTQMPNLPIVQIASITGIWGISFLLTFIPASIAFLWHYRHDKKLRLQTGIITAIIFLSTICFGLYRLYIPHKEQKIKVGIAALQLNRTKIIDLYENDDQAVADHILNRYEICIESLAKQDAKFVLLPEEVIHLQENNKNLILSKFKSIAQKNGIYLIVGALVKDQDKFYNSAYLFLPNGNLAFRYDKQYLIPFAEEANYTPGNKLEIWQTDLGKFGVAICKDMDFIEPSRSYNLKQIDALFVPAWDFGYDAWLHGRIALMRGIEGNFSVARAGQDGLLTLSDSRGRIIASTSTRFFTDCATLIGEIPIGSNNYFKYTNLMIVDFNSGQIIRSIGDCQTQESPYSTFKIALSLMGFDSGILKDENNPEWPYKDECNAPFDFWRQPHTPKMWTKNSCVWYSQKLTSILGMDKFARYVQNFEYGNQDVSGNPGKNDGLSGAWLNSSLKISPQQQVEFIKQLLTNSLPVSKYAHEQTKKILFNSDLGGGWKLYAKTGGGGIWFVGWTVNEIQNKTYIFACLEKAKTAKQTVLNELNKVRGLDETI